MQLSWLRSSGLLKIESRARVSRNSEHDARIARFQPILDRLEQVTQQANDLSQMARELRVEADESTRLLKQLAPRSRGKGSRTKRR